MTARQAPSALRRKTPGDRLPGSERYDLLTRIIPIAACALLAACAGKPPLQQGPGLTLADATSMPAPSARAEYPIGPFDTLEIEVAGLPDFNKRVQVDAAGNISTSLVGSIRAAGRSPREVAELIEAGMRAKFVRNPQVAVNLTQTVGHTLTVDGQVGEPGRYPVIGKTTLGEAVASAKGATEFADLADVVVFRTVDGQRWAALYNLEAIRRGLYEDPQVYADDLIVVGDSPARRRLRDILQAGGLIATPIVALLQNI